jgi:hypothetical protein
MVMGCPNKRSAIRAQPTNFHHSLIVPPRHPLTLGTEFEPGNVDTDSSEICFEIYGLFKIYDSEANIAWNNSHLIKLNHRMLPETSDRRLACSRPDKNLEMKFIC